MARPIYPSDNVDKLLLRFPEGMRDRIKDAAKKSGRSMNAEVVHRLANSLDHPRFEDFALGLGEELDFDLMLAAEQSGRSLRDELIYRLKQTLTHQPTLVSTLEGEAWHTRRKLDEIMELFIQLTPEERRILEERVEVTSKRNKDFVGSKFIGELTTLKPIGKSGRIALTVPSKRDLFPDFSKS